MWSPLRVLRIAQDSSLWTMFCNVSLYLHLFFNLVIQNWNFILQTRLQASSLLRSVIHYKNIAYTDTCIHTLYSRRLPTNDNLSCSYSMILNGLVHRFERTPPIKEVIRHNHSQTFTATFYANHRDVPLIAAGWWLRYIEVTWIVSYLRLSLFDICLIVGNFAIHA